MVMSILTSAQRGAGVPDGEGLTVRVTLPVAEEEGVALIVAVMDGVAARVPVEVAVAVAVEVVLGESPADRVVEADGVAIGVRAAVPEAEREATADGDAELPMLLLLAVAAAEAPFEPLALPVAVREGVTVVVDEGVGLADCVMTGQPVFRAAAAPPTPHTALKARGMQPEPAALTTKVEPAELLLAGHTSAGPAMPADRAGVLG